MVNMHIAQLKVLTFLLLTQPNTAVSHQSRLVTTTRIEATQQSTRNSQIIIGSNI